MQERDADKKKKITLISMEELKKAIGILVYMSVAKAPGVQSYFQGITKQNIVLKAMQKSRFETICQISISVTTASSRLEMIKILTNSTSFASCWIT